MMTNIIKQPNEKVNTLTIIFEKGEDGLWGRIENEDFLLTECGNNHDEVLEGLKVSLLDYLENEGKEDSKWSKVNIDDITFDFRYDLTEFFEQFSMLKISSIAEISGINQSLMRQYVRGLAYPSEKQVAKIQEGIRRLSESLFAVQLC